MGLAGLYYSMLNALIGFLGAFLAGTVSFALALGTAEEARAQSPALREKGKALVSAFNCKVCHRVPDENQSDEQSLPGPDLTFEKGGGS